MAYIKKINKEARDAAIIDTWKTVRNVTKTAEITGAHRRACIRVLKNHSVSDTNKTCSKPIAMLTPDGKYIRSFESQTHAVQYLRETGKSPNAAHPLSVLCVTEKKATAYGCKWAFLDETETPIICDYATQVYNKPASMYSLSGEYIRSFRSAREAARYIKGSHSSISNTCAGITQQACGYQWRYEQDGDNSLTPIKKYQSVLKPVLMYSATGEYIRTFDSIINAATYIHAQGLAKSVHGAETNIKSVLRGKSKTACGYEWQYQNPELNGPAHKPRPVSMFSLDDKWLRDFDTITDAAQYLLTQGQGVTHHTIRRTVSQALKGIDKTAYGYKWAYANTQEK